METIFDNSTFDETIKNMTGYSIEEIAGMYGKTELIKSTMYAYSWKIKTKNGKWLTFGLGDEELYILYCGKTYEFDLDEKAVDCLEKMAKKELRIRKILSIERTFLIKIILKIFSFDNKIKYEKIDNNVYKITHKYTNLCHVYKI